MKITSILDSMAKRVEDLITIIFHCSVMHRWPEMLGSQLPNVAYVLPVKNTVLDDTVDGR